MRKKIFSVITTYLTSGISAHAASPHSGWIRYTHQYQYMSLKIAPAQSACALKLASGLRSGGWRELDDERKWKIIRRQETCSYRPGEPSRRSPTFPPARHLWRIWGFHNFLFFLKGGWQHLVHTAVLHLESNLKRARGRGEERSSLVIKGSRMASVC